MRKGVFKGGEIIYPNLELFIFNPCIIKVQIESPITFTIKSKDGVAFVDRREPLKGVVSIDISGYAQSLFASVNKTRYSTIPLTVELSSDGETKSIAFNAIWGSLNIGQQYNYSRTVRWYVNFPFSVSYYIADKNVEVIWWDDTDDNRHTLLPSTEDIGVVNTLMTTTPPAGIKEAYIEVIDALAVGGYQRQPLLMEDGALFLLEDGDVLLLESDNPPKITITMVADYSTCGIYLRWIDNRGFHNYWLFQQGDDITETDDYGEAIYQDLDDGNISYSGMYRQQGKKVQKRIKACACFVTQEEYRQLRTISEAILIDMYVDGVWVPVNVKNGTTTRKSASLQDFEIEIIMPDTITQRL